MANARVEVIKSVQRRRRWSSAEKERLVAATLEAGASVSAVARSAGVHPSRLYGWRRQLCGRPASPGFAAVRATRPCRVSPTSHSSRPASLASASLTISLSARMVAAGAKARRRRLEARRKGSGIFSGAGVRMGRAR